MVAEWVVGNEKPLGVGTLFQLPRFDESGTLVSHPLEPNFFENTAEDELVRPLIRDIHLKHNIQASVVLPLYNKGRWVAGILFGWNVPQQFNEDDTRIYTLIQQQAAPVVDSIRLFEQTQRRATELEAANQEINLLYRTSEIINGANTYEEVVEAVAQFDPDADVVTLMLWENLDWETATYLDVVTVLHRTGSNLVEAGSGSRKMIFQLRR